MKPLPPVLDDPEAAIFRPLMHAILLTAFGPFGGRRENASSLVLQGIKPQFPGVRTRILPVDSVLGPARLRQALATIRPRAVVMLGEAAGSNTIRLETTAWNSLDFRIPDIAGRMPSDRPIEAGGPDQIGSTLPIESLRQRLEKGGHQVTLSDDPGRYLCNQVFFLARSWLERWAPGCPAGFIHLPLESDYPTKRATLAIAEVLRELGER